MIELLFVACLSLSPTDCREQSLLYSEVTPMACMMGAQPELAKWVESHPKFQVKSWKCKMVNLNERDA